jgi:hypothetical protein
LARKCAAFFGAIVCTQPRSACSSSAQRLPVYKLLTLLVPAPTLPPELYLPTLTVILAALYLTEKWRAWTGNPALRMDTTIEKDDSVGCFRLRFWNDHLPACKPRVIVEGVVNNHGKVLAVSLPLELERTNHQGERPALSPHDAKGESVAVVRLAPWPWQVSTPVGVYLYGQKNQLSIGTVRDFVGGWFDVDLVAYLPDFANTDRIARRFRFYYDENEVPMFFRPELVT